MKYRNLIQLAAVYVCVTFRVSITVSQLVRNEIDVSGGLYEKHPVVTLNLGTISGFP
jgi:hypothetical protein